LSAYPLFISGILLFWDSSVCTSPTQSFEHRENRHDVLVISLALFSENL
jgi:hypothetical protein